MPSRLTPSLWGGRFTSDDVIGCGLHFRTREIFFTKNGKNLGVAFTEPGHAYYPTVGLHSQGETVTLNFGSRPFVFPLDEMLREEREKLRQTVSRVPLELSTVHHLVRDYLATEGLSESLKSFEAAAGLAELPDPSDDGSADDTMPEVQSNGTVDANGTNGAAEARSACSEVRQNGAREHTSQITSRSGNAPALLPGASPLRTIPPPGMSDALGEGPATVHRNPHADSFRRHGARCRCVRGRLPGPAGHAPARKGVSSLPGAASYPPRCRAAHALHAAGPERGFGRRCRST